MMLFFVGNIVVVLFVIFHCILSANGLLGVDLSTRMESEDWDIMEASLGDIITFASVHTLFYNMTFNPHAVPTLVSAWQRGLYF